LREITYDSIVQAVKSMTLKAASDLGQDVEGALKGALEKEESSVGKGVLNQIVQNVGLAREGHDPICQDTGFHVFFVELGSDVHVSGGMIGDAITEGLREGSSEGFLRNSILGDPLERVNTGDNTPPVVHVGLVPGDGLKITLAPKGGGSENMSRLAMLKPADGEEGVRKFVIETISLAGGNPCPPVVVGVGIGGTFEKCAMLAKKAVTREVGSKHAVEKYAKMESELLEEINKLGVGPMGLGGKVTALAVHIETYPCHIASLPVAVNVNCHAARHSHVEL
jgi:fumarate hydratase subunit alpha